MNFRKKIREIKRVKYLNNLVQKLRFHMSQNQLSALIMSLAN